jgi:glycosyltransferase involved in cell wall biosynthesis
LVTRDDHTELSDPSRLVSEPLVSVLMLAYNHGPWIAEAIESVLAQDCEFEYELIIGEDASGDDTRAIALAYQQAHPERIRVVFPQKNCGANANIRQIFGLSRGEFIAYCEGDDYWCRRDKLAAQVALLRAQPQAAVVHADWVRARWKAGSWRIAWDKSSHRRVPLRRLQGDLFPVFYFPRILRTCTSVQRRSALKAFYESTLSARRYRFGDTVKAAFLTSRWPVAYWPEIAAVYRESPGSALRSGRRGFVDFLRSAMEFDTNARAYFIDRPDYPFNYRWESAIGLVWQGARLGNFAAVQEAIRDLAQRYSPVDFLRAGWGALRMRWPLLVRVNRRSPPPGR